MHPKDSFQRHGSYFNAMVAPIIPLAVKGVILYHCSANANVPEEYAVLFPMLIADWREQWQREDLPFICVQLANYRKVQYEPVQKRDRLPFVREAQSLGFKELHTAMVVTTDLGGVREQYLKDKTKVAERLYQATKEIVYNEKPYSQCPAYFYIKIEKGKVIVTFDHLGGGLVAKGDELTGFAITGADRQWKWAKSKMANNKVILWHIDIPLPAAVRYNWADNPTGNLYSREGYPASSFRTDWTRDSISKHDQAK